MATVLTVTLDSIDAAPIADTEFDPQFLQWLWVLVDSLNETLIKIQDGFNFLTAPNVALLTETVTLTSGSPLFNVADGSVYNVGDNVVGGGIPPLTKILSIDVNAVTLTANATSSGASALTFIPLDGDIGNGVLLYDLTTNVYVGMQNDALVQFTTSAYP